MREVVVFTGPTLAAEEVASELEATVLPPVSKGDLYAVARRGPFAVGIIDGFFDRVPSVWHKEILWAMSRGVHVFGSASMGALRAAELHQFGMVGVGTVFEAYRDGVLTDDDEVAVAHLPERLGFRARSVAMVNIRATLDAATEDGVVSRRQRDALVARAKSMPYADRTYTALLSGGDSGVFEPLAARRLAAWIETHAIDRKREDALVMLRRLQRLRDEEDEPLRVGYPFSHTLMWEGLKREVDRAEGARSERLLPPCDALEELRLDPGAYQRAMERTWRRLLALELARSRGEALDVSERARGEERWRARRGLDDEGRLRAWCAREEVDAALLGRLVEDEALIGRVEHDYAPNAEMYLRDHLRSSGQFGGLLDRARRKRACLERLGLENPSVADTDLAEAELWRWYFEDRLGLESPSDPWEHGARVGFSSEALFTRAVVRERLFMTGREDGRTLPGT